MTYCYNCFREREEGAGCCPYCGYDPAMDREKYPFALPHGSILAGQYIIAGSWVRVASASPTWRWTRCWTSKWR